MMSILLLFGMLTARDKYYETWTNECPEYFFRGQIDRNRDKLGKPERLNTLSQSSTRSTRVGPLDCRCVRVILVIDTISNKKPNKF